ncbi:MAG: discoidin domain-containing protein [Pirellulales bacterium]|nr:discoidin domain-containing protein [Pirellulales bacterium]
MPPTRVKGDGRGKVGLGFSSIFWNTAWTDRQLPHTLGILCDPEHPLFAAFPTEYYSNWQWWYLVSRGGAMILDGLPPDLRPLVQGIDDWVTNRRLGLAFEARMGRGKLLVCSIDLEHELEADPVRRQFRQSLFEYMASNDFAPQHEVTVEQIQSLMHPQSPMDRLGVIAVTTDSEEMGSEGYLAIDGNPKTFWHTQWRAGGPALPHTFQVEFKSPIAIRGFTALPRQDGVRNGWINDYLFYASDDGKEWGQPIARGSFSADKELKTIELAKPVTARFFRLVATSAFDTRPYASIAEFTVLPAEKDLEGAMSPKASSHEIRIDKNSTGLRYDGVGAVSSGGSSRLLVDYPEKQRNEILDYLFKPNYGAALQILKVEIGADTDATCGAEPSHMRTPNEINCERGYEWWLVNEAKARNPDIKLYALAWGAPGWLKDGFWSDDNIRYTIAWLDCAKKHGLHIDYLGGGNERGWNAEYYVKLSKALDEHGYGHIQVVATDDHNPPNYWSVADEMKQNPEFADAVDVLGQHDVCVWRSQQRCCFVSDQAASMGKPLWDSENSTQDYLVGAEPLARVMNRHYIDARITGNLNWALVGGYYGNFPAPGTGLILADRPWSGYYDVGAIVWVNAHTTQFVQPGWRYLDDACGYTPGGASYVTLRPPQGDDFTMVIETLDLATPETMEIHIAEGLSKGDICVWATDLSTDSLDDDFILTATIQPDAGTIRLPTQPGHIYTLSTTRGQHKSDVQSLASAEERMPLRYREDFEKLRSTKLAPYFADVHGAFEASPCGGGRAGMCYRQVIQQEPILWHGAKMPPTTIIGDPLWWGDYEVSVDALLEQPGYVELLGRVEGQQHNAAGYHLQVSNTGTWRLFSEDERGSEHTLASGQAPEFGIGRWHRLGLHFLGNEVTAFLDGERLASVPDESHTTGQVGLRVSAWQNAQFDNLEITPTASAPQFVPHAELMLTAASEQSENDFGSIFTARKAIDDRVETAWMPAFGRMASEPQWITADLQRAREVSGLAYKPPIVNTKNTAITAWKVSLSHDNQTFEEAAAGTWEPTGATKTVFWPTQVARYVRLEPVAGTTSWPRDGVAVSELNVIVPPSGADSITVSER